MKKIAVIFFVGIIFSGCSIFNPYKSEFTCPDTYKGKCVSAVTAYNESIGNSPNLSPELHSDLEYNYRTSLYNKLASMIHKPATPIALPPKVMRTLILSYTGSDNDLYSYRYVYFFATEPKWIFSTTKEIN